MLVDFSACRILVVGDAMLDRYWSGATERVSPEAPVPIVAVTGDETRPGGAANVAVGLAALGATTTLLAPIGKDAEGRLLERLIKRAGVASALLTYANVRTTVKLRVTSHQQQLVRLDFEQPLPDLSNNLLRRFRTAVRDCDAVILSDYAKGALADPQPLIAAAKKAGVPVFVDPKRTDFAAYAGATAVTPNRAELEAVAGGPLTLDAIGDTAGALCRRHKLRMMLVTLGADGMLLCHGKQRTLLPAHARNVFDVTGAGDTVIATFACAHTAGAKPIEAMHLANLAASQAVTKFGAATVSAPELMEGLGLAHYSERGIVERRELAQRIDAAHDCGETVVMTNGCFDLLHAGHVSLLQRAAELGDRLVVAVNTDASIRKLKGTGRPILKLEHRLRMLAGLECVDWVVAFSEATPEALIKSATPDILVKGADYKKSEVAGGKAVAAAGGKVVLLPLLEGPSTSDLVQHIKDH